MEKIGSPRQNGHSGEPGGSRAQSRTGVQVGDMYTDIGVRCPGAVGGFGGGGGDLQIMVDLVVREDTLEVVVGKEATEQDVGVVPFVQEPVVQGTQ